MHWESVDFNGADRYFGAEGAAEWEDIASVVTVTPLFLQPSEQRGKVGIPIFDPKATNAYLNAESRKRGWTAIPVPSDLTAFGVDWDGGKHETLAEWQFSNYPFLWNNVIRSEAVHKSRTALPGLQPIRALIIVTKSGLFPASNSTLYYEQARAQLDAVTMFGAFTIPIRLVGLTLPLGLEHYDVVWSTYEARYGRSANTQEPRSVQVTWGRPGRFGVPRASFG